MLYLHEMHLSLGRNCLAHGCKPKGRGLTPVVSRGWWGVGDCLPRSILEACTSRPIESYWLEPWGAELLIV